MSSMIADDQSPSSSNQIASNNGRGISLFQGAHHFSVRNPNFLSVQGNYYAGYATQMSVGLAALNQQISHGAMFDSSARYSRGRVHPGTRQKVIESIRAWIDDPTPDESVLWVHGSAGIGKSAIMQTIAELLVKEQKERCAGSFFFAKDVDGRKDGNSLFATLAYQVAINLPGMRELIDEAMNNDPSLPTKSMEVQLESLLLGPLKKCSTDFLGHAPTVIIDGLDECHNSDTQTRILTLIADAVTSSNLPLRFLIASRPEYWIRDSFVQHTLSSTTKKLSLNDPESGADDDIEKYFLDEFDNIYVKKAKFMSNVARPWPSEDTVWRLVRDASGHFAHACIVIKFVGHSSDYCDPVKQLQVITSPGPERATAFTELDKLYMRILSVFPRPESLKVVLGGLLLMLHPRAIEFYLGIDLNEVNMVLESLSSLIELNQSALEDELDEVYDTSYPRIFSIFCHLSFREFLQDQNRSGDFYIDAETTSKQVAVSFTQAIMDGFDGKCEPQDRRIDPMSIESAADVVKHAARGDPEFIAARLLPLFTHLVNKTPKYPPGDSPPVSNAATLICHLEQLEDIISSYRNQFGTDFRFPSYYYSSSGTDKSQVPDMGYVVPSLKHSPHLVPHLIQAPHSVLYKVPSVLHEQIYPDIVRFVLSTGHLTTSKILTALMAKTDCKLSDLTGDDLSSAKEYIQHNRDFISRYKFEKSSPTYRLLRPIPAVLEKDAEATVPFVIHSTRARRRLRERRVAGVEEEDEYDERTRKKAFSFLLSYNPDET